MSLKVIKHVFMAAEGDAGAGSGGAAEGAAGAAAGAEGSAGAAGSGGSASSALAAGGAADSSAAVAINELIPEKFRVTNAEGAFDLEATTRKLNASYTELEKARGTPAEKAPDTPEAYAPELKIDGFKWDEVKADPKMQGFLKRMHGKGLNNSQLSEVLSAYYEAAPDLIAGNAVLTQEACEAELAKTWNTPELLNGGLKAAADVVKAFGPAAGVTLADLEASGAANNPAVLRLLASIRPELSEDRVPQALGGGSNETLAELMAHPAYSDPKHKDHEAVSKKVRMHYERKYPQAS